MVVLGGGGVLMSQVPLSTATGHEENLDAVSCCAFQTKLRTQMAAVWIACISGCIVVAVLVDDANRDEKCERERKKLTPFRGAWLVLVRGTG